MLPEEDFWMRLAIEADEMKREQPSFEPVDGDVTRWKGFIIGTGQYDLPVGGAAMLHKPA